MPRTANCERAPKPRIEMRWSSEKLYRLAAYTPGTVTRASSSPHVGRARLISVLSTRCTASGILLIGGLARGTGTTDRKSTRLNSSHLVKSDAAFCFEKKNKTRPRDLSHRR